MFGQLVRLIEGMSIHGGLSGLPGRVFGASWAWAGRCGARREAVLLMNLWGAFRHAIGIGIKLSMVIEASHSSATRMRLFQ